MKFFKCQTNEAFTNQFLRKLFSVLKAIND